MLKINYPYFVLKVNKIIACYVWIYKAIIAKELYRFSDFGYYCGGDIFKMFSINMRNIVGVYFFPLSSSFQPNYIQALWERQTMLFLLTNYRRKDAFDIRETIPRS
jgi:hypothetical protein